MSTAKAREWTRGFVVATLLLVVGCGDDGDEPSAVDSESTVEPDSTATTNAAAPEPTGEPIVIGVVNAENNAVGSIPETREGIEAVVAYANAELGGIGGRPIEIETCITDNTPEGARSCANELVEKDVAAVVLGATAGSEQLVAVLAPAGIPYMTCCALSVEEFSTDGSFSVSGGTFGNYAAVALYAESQGWDRVSYIGLDVPAVAGVVDAVLRPAFDNVGVELNAILSPPGTPDMTPFVVEASESEPDAILVHQAEAQCISAMSAMGNLAVASELVLMSNGCQGPQIEAGVPADVYIGATLAANQMFNEADDPTEESALYRRVLEEYAPDTELSGFAQRGYATMMGFIRATAGITDVTAAGVGEAIRASGDVDIPLGAGLTFNCDGASVPGLVSACSASTIFLEIGEDNELTFLETQDATELLEELGS